MPPGYGSQVICFGIIALCVRSSLAREISRFPSSSDASCPPKLLKSAHSGVVCPHQYDARSTWRDTMRHRIGGHISGTAFRSVRGDGRSSADTPLMPLALGRRVSALVCVLEVPLLSGKSARRQCRISPPSRRGSSSPGVDCIWLSRQGGVLAHSPSIAVPSQSARSQLESFRLSVSRHVRPI